MSQDHDDSARVNMEIALENVCRGLPAEVADHATRRVIAEKIIAAADTGFIKLSSLRAAGERALVALRRTTVA